MILILPENILVGTLKAFVINVLKIILKKRSHEFHKLKL